MKFVLCLLFLCLAIVQISEAKGRAKPTNPPKVTCGDCWWGYCDRGGTGRCHTFYDVKSATHVWHCLMPGGNCPIGEMCFTYNGHNYYKQKPAKPCPINGGVSDWTMWIECSVTCEGTGYQIRIRTCSNPAPAHGGAPCTESMIEKQACSSPQPCPVDGGVSAWSAWGTCSTTCGNGKESRMRTCSNPAPAHGGANCTESMHEQQACPDPQPCPIDGGVSEWSAWGTCSTTCGNGKESRTRACSNPAPKHGGEDCTESLYEKQACANLQPCPVDGGVSAWSAWGTCSTTCGNGKESRTRTCSNPAPAHGGADCTESMYEKQTCPNLQPCPVDGGVSAWSAWGTCSTTCGNGKESRTRTCSNPAPAHGGAVCTESMHEQQACPNPQPCPVDGGVSAWSAWGTCSTTCGNGTESRTRTCTNPKPEHGGRSCGLAMTESKVCVNAKLCAIEGGWGDWQPWQPCTRTCGPAIQRRRRLCNSPPPSNGGRECMGMPFGQKKCINSACTTPANYLV